jgi:hypothetical protein
VAIGYIDGMEIYYRRFCGKGAPWGRGYFVTVVVARRRLVVVELLNFHRQNRRHIRRTETPINSTVILGNREYKQVGAAYYGTHTSAHLSYTQIPQFMKTMV